MKDERMIQMTFQTHDTLGNIVTAFPNSAHIFKKYQIDYCCGGDRTLKEAVSDTELKAETLVNELSEYYKSLEPSTNDWTLSPLDELIQYILQAHHAYLYNTLPKLSQLTAKILRVHGKHHPELSDVFQTFHALKTEMDMHLIKEETVQYPAIETYLQSHKQEDLNQAVNVITELKDEHSNTGDALKKLRKITDNYHIPEDVCETFVKTYKLLEELESNTFTHIHLENNILFKRLEKLDNRL
ncbi:MAG: iron-sulfur cluster repair di-iron protein [Candidatus Izemoplasma sp.]|nr:iron-sulfur cluster repair di-iron protein [Candidatus Izemoplasma sp.]